ncbi:MAG: AMP-binding protein [Proteobacteria bacterium]|nr:AMP-binding protein [Pseudomonadota bacterium]
MTEEAAKIEVPNYLEINWEKHPDKLVLAGVDRSLTYDQLRNRAQTLAKCFYQMGVRPGDQVSLMAYNSAEVMEVSNALAYMQVGFVMVGYRMKPPEIEYIVNNSDSKLLIFFNEFADRILPYRDKFPKILDGGFISYGGATSEGAQDYETVIADSPDMDFENLPAATKAGNSMIYTSGTTGMPKGAARSTDFVKKDGVLDYVFGSMAFFNIAEDEVHLVCCPIYHSAPSYFNLQTFMSGGTLVYMPRFDALEFLKLVEKHKVTSTHLVPTMVTRLLDLPEEQTAGLDLSSFRTAIVGAAPLFPEYKTAFLERYGLILYEYYGATETGINTAITPAEMKERPSSVGKAFINNDLKIFDDQGKEVPNGERGILYMHNSIMMDGYYKNDSATSEAHIGKHMTAGDVAIRDEEGYIYIVDRVKDMIIRGGVNIYPVEVEGVLSTMPEIADVAVVGKHDKELQETVAAFIVPAEGATVTEDTLQTFCKDHLANYKIPSTLMIVDEIPRTPTGKILKRDLRERL